MKVVHEIEKTFEFIDGKHVNIRPAEATAIYGINDKQIYFMFNYGYKGIVNVSFEEMERFLVDNSFATWVYVPGICGHTVMIDVSKIADISKTNETQSKIEFYNHKYLYIDMIYDNLVDRIEFAKRAIATVSLSNAQPPR